MITALKHSPVLNYKIAGVMIVKTINEIYNIKANQCGTCTTGKETEILKAGCFRT